MISEINDTWFEVRLQAFAVTGASSFFIVIPHSKTLLVVVLLIISRTTKSFNKHDVAQRLNHFYWRKSLNRWFVCDCHIFVLVCVTTMGAYRISSSDDFRMSHDVTVLISGNPPATSSFNADVPEHIHISINCPFFVISVSV